MKTASTTFQLAAASFLIGGFAIALNEPLRYEIPTWTMSPDHRYGVTVPILSANLAAKDEPEATNKLVDVKTGRVLAIINAEFTGWNRMNNGEVLPVRWSRSGSCLLWEVSGKWSADALVLLKMEGSGVIWQVDLRKTGQQAILARLLKAKPQEYLAIKQARVGVWGSAYPDGFAVDVYAGDYDGKRPLLFPLPVHVDLTSDTKAFDPQSKKARIDAQLDGVVDEDGKFTVLKFHLGRSAQLPRYWEPN